MNKVHVGREAEQRAAEHLQEKGYHILARNFKFMHLGELDIVARDGDTLVFVEVRYRRSRNYGTPEGSLTPKKLQTVRRTAQAWMARNNYHRVPCRFDMIAVELVEGNEEIRHYVNAF
ncbi:MAG TPA: YraN family protein [Candidatus Didemnitutus sp.]|nr:YraN family protein [Candidatus Didemnitutus sp.]